MYSRSMSKRKTSPIILIPTAICIVALIVGIVATGGTFLLGFALAANVAVFSFNLTNIIKENRHGSDRRAKEDPFDSQASTGTVPINPSNTAPATGNSGSRTSLTVPDKPYQPKYETVESDMPILAHRIAHLYFDGAKPFGSLNGRTRFATDAQATCTRYESPFSRIDLHAVPALNCSCGFYALPSDVEPWGEGAAWVTLMVELSGKVIEHEKGYRAEHQRVVECQVPACPFCGDQATSILTVNGQMVSTVCDRHAPLRFAEGSVLVSIPDVEAIVKVPVTCQGRMVESHHDQTT